MPYIRNIWQIWRFCGLLNVVLHFQCYENNGQMKTKKMEYFSRKTEEKQKAVTIMISVDGKRTV